METAQDAARDENEERHAVWERAHELGSPTHRLRTWLVLKTVRSLEQAASCGACLDAGCGTGEFLVALAERGWTVTGFDPSEYAIDLARKRAARAGVGIDCSVAGIDDFSVGETFDLVLAVDVLEHIEDDARAMSRLAGFVRPGGAVLVTVPMDPALWSAADEFSGHFRRYTRQSLTGVAQGAGLEVERVLSYGFPFTRVLWLAKRRVPAAESLVVSSAESRGLARRAVARSVSALARGITGMDRLFTRGDRGVGLVAVFRKPLDRSGSAGRVRL